MKKYVFLGIFIFFLISFKNVSANSSGTLSFNNYYFNIVSQNGDFLFVSSEPEEVTLFGHPSIGMDTIGLLAHEYLAGKYFYELEANNFVRVNSKIYGIYSIEYFEQLDSSTMKRKSTGEILSNVEVFFFIYGEENKLILQTCSNDGFMFIIAYPIKTWEIRFPIIYNQL